VIENKIKVSELPPAARTLLIPLAYRAEESRRSDALLRDDMAAALMGQFDEDYFRLVRGQRMERVCVLMRARQLDRYARDFVAAHPGAIVADIGCGLDTRASRMDPETTTWYGLDFPEVIALRERLLSKQRNEIWIAQSVMDFSWMDMIARERRPVIFLAEGVMPYLEEREVRRLILRLTDCFPGAEMAFDAINHFSALAHRLTHKGIRQAGARLGWWLNDGRELETWSPRVRLLEEWTYFSQDEQRLRKYRWMRHFKTFLRANRILHLRFSDPEKG